MSDNPLTPGDFDHAAEDMLPAGPESKPARADSSAVPGSPSALHDVLRPYIPPRTQREPLPLAELPGPLDRIRPARRQFLTQRSLMIIGAAVGVLLLAGLVFAALMHKPDITVPNVIGRSQADAETMLKGMGLTTAITERRFSDQPVGEVLAQSPPSGAVLKKGEPVKLIVSRGNEERTMPDLVGMDLARARTILEARGLKVMVDSTSATDTVLSTIPAAGEKVKSGDTVRIRVASTADVQGLTPIFDLHGLVIVIDPAPVTVAPGVSDVPLELSRKLQSLLINAGAEAIALRSVSTSTTAPTDRQAAALRANASLSVGLSMRASGQAGRQITQRPSDETSASAVAQQIAQASFGSLSQSAPPIQATTSASDEVFTGLPGPWIRVSLGSYSDQADLTAFSDPAWLDSVARSLYSAIGQVMGKRVAQ